MNAQYASIELGADPIDVAVIDYDGYVISENPLPSVTYLVDEHPDASPEELIDGARFEASEVLRKHNWSPDGSDFTWTRVESGTEYRANLA